MTDAARDFFSALVRSETRLYNTLNETLRVRHGIAASQFEFLDYIHSHPGCRAADLAEAFATGVGAASKGIDRLTERGWVRRMPNPGDGRSFLLELTNDGGVLVTAAAASFNDLLAAVLVDAGLSASLDYATKALVRLRGFLEDNQIGKPAG